MRPTGSEGRRLKPVIVALCVAPLLVGAIVTVASGGAGPVAPPTAGRPAMPKPGTNLNSGQFDELTMAVPQRPGVDGRLGSDRPARIDVPVVGATDGSSVVRPGRRGAVNGIPRGVFPAYRRATANLAVVRPDCGLTWPLLAAIGKVESGHAGGGRVDVVGTTRGRILGPVLNGKGGTARVKDTDDGRLDRDPAWDRAVGPMQLIPGVWPDFGADGNGDGFRNPHNVYDAVTTVAVYLCAEGDDLKRPRDLVAALLRYHHSKDFVATVLRWMRVYTTGAVLVPNAKGSVSVAKPTGNAERTVDPRKVPSPGKRPSASPKPTKPQSGPTPTPSDRPTDRPSDPPTPSDEPTAEPTPEPSATPTPTPTPSLTPTGPTDPTPSEEPCSEGASTPCPESAGAGQPG